MWDKKYITELENQKSKAYAGGGEERIKKQHSQNKLTARERLDILFDEGTFEEVGTYRQARPDIGKIEYETFPGDGVVTGFGLVDGRLVFASSEDFTVNGGTLGEVHSKKICHIQDLAMKAKAPFISINDSGGARIEEGINSIAGYSGIFLRNTQASGIIPQISVMLGPCAGGACYSPAISDFIFMSENARMFVTGPVVVKAAIFEEVSSEDLGGAKIHASRSGVCHFIYKDDRETLLGVRKLLSYLPQNCDEKAPYLKTEIVDKSEELQSIVPENMKEAYDVRKVVETFVDKDTFFEVHKNFAPNAVVGFARMDGETIGIVANQPFNGAGILDIDSSDKIARFIRFCDCFNIPIISLIDVPGFLPGSNQEHNGIIRHGAKILFAYSEATVPKIGLIMRKAFGGAYIAMNSKNMGADLVYAWPIAQIAVMGPEGAVDIIHKKEIKKSVNPWLIRNKLITEYEEKYLNPYFGAANGYIDEIIEPEETRRVLSRALKMLKNKERGGIEKRHGNMPV